MKVRVLTILCLVLFFVPPTFAQKINWFSDLNAAKKKAKETGKPILLDFTATWCGPCNAMDREFWIREDVIELSKSIIFVKIDSDKNTELKRQYSVRGIPHLTIIDIWGEELANHTGYSTRNSDVIVGKISSVSMDLSPIADAGNLLEKNFNDLSSLAAMAEFYQKRRQFSRSNDFYFRILALEKNPEQRESLLLNLGFNFLRIGRLDEAKEMFGKFQTESPQSKNIEMALHGEIMTLVQMKKLDHAEKVFVSLKTEFPKSLMIAQSNQVISDAKLK